MAKLLLTLASVLFSTVLTVADEVPKLDKKEVTARDFSFEKTKLGTTLEEFKKRYPDAREVESDKKLGTVLLGQQAESAHICGYAFFDGKLYEMRIAYNSKDIEKMGGFTVLTDRLVSKFGKAHDGKVEEDPFKVKMVWEFPNADRFIVLNVDDELARLDVTDIKLYGELNEKQKKAAKTGFDD